MAYYRIIRRGNDVFHEIIGVGRGSLVINPWSRGSGLWAKVEGRRSKVEGRRSRYIFYSARSASKSEVVKIILKMDLRNSSHIQNQSTLLAYSH